MKSFLVVVDMQNDFIDGALGTREAMAIVDGVAEYIRGFDGEIIFTRDTHSEDYLESAEGKRLPVVHCIKESHGWQIREGLYSEGCRIVDKPSFGSVELAEYLKARSGGESCEITLVGLCTDICVISNALVLKAFLPESEIRVIASLCAGVTPDSHTRALSAMESCQITVVR